VTRVRTEKGRCRTLKATVKAIESERGTTRARKAMREEINDRNWGVYFTGLLQHRSTVFILFYEL